MFDKRILDVILIKRNFSTAIIPFDDKKLYHAFRDNKYIIIEIGFIPETKTFDDISAYQQYIRGKTKVGEIIILIKN